MAAALTTIDYYLPERVLDNSELANDFPEWNSEKIKRKTGICERRIASEGETSLDLAEKVCVKLFATVDKDEIDFMLLCTQSPDYFLPTGACILQDRLGLRKNVGALDFNLGCSGFIYGLALANGLIDATIAETVLLITSETYSKFIHPKDKGNRTIFGDGAGATIIKRSNRTKIGKFVFGTDGSGWQTLIVRNGGIRNRCHTQKPMNGDGGFDTSNHLYMDGPEVFNFTIKTIPKLIDKILLANGTTLDAIDYVIFHQANKFMLEHLRKKTEIPQEKFHIDLTSTGNTVSATIPIAMKQCLDSGRIGAGDKLLLVGFGVGNSWGGVVVDI